ncbi:MAG: bifunctional diaminohydroxyphosphoribosylaminopyrimidine deaminase/5-amino-6-(5-phosphoribosylamino)uracil reductase RibD [Flavobacterium sp.]|nr:bifunctional diaminohydroxyphosphoribosylaminopyrimidine deaminase/5-amino-6-(5-phosphoribosylamino)uracil reductase RibD [Flavobacterium sp.]
MKVHEKYIKRCIELAKNGLGTTYPNPLVGSVIVYKNEIIGEGWHQKSGEAHAEVNAVNAVKNQSLLSKATIYVSLEPCSHFGKTPPCCDLIIKHKIPNVVVGTIDSFSEVSGNGIKKLMAAGKNVTVGVLEKECRELNKRFFTFHEKKRPYIILKWAESQDGFIAPAHKEIPEPVWITNVFSRQLVHKWRTEEQAILVGTKTVIVDNPRLDARDWKGGNPVRIVLDNCNRIPKESHIFDGKQKTILLSGTKSGIEKENLHNEMMNFDGAFANGISDILHKNELQSVIIEGGRQTLQSFIDAGIWDEARVFRGSIILKNGIKAPILNNILFEKQLLKSDELLIYRKS